MDKSLRQATLGRTADLMDSRGSGGCLTMVEGRPSGTITGAEVWEMEVGPDQEGPGILK